MSVYQRDGEAAPDEAFEPGELWHLRVGNAGRLLDHRRTPVRIVELDPDRGMMILRIEAFEDEGARWEIPFEEVGQYQFARDQARAREEETQRFQAAIARLDELMRIPRDAGKEADSRDRIEERRREATIWLQGNSRFFREGRELPDPASRLGDPLLCEDQRAFMGERNLADMDEAFARSFVSNPHAGELIKGHRIVMAELGLVDYAGKVLRDPGLFDGEWSKKRRGEHILTRLGLTRAIFQLAGRDRVVLHRGMSTAGSLRPPDNTGFVSASFSVDVARAHFDNSAPEETSALYRQAVPLERLFMSFHETPEMNARFREAEAVLLYDPEQKLF